MNLYNKFKNYTYSHRRKKRYKSFKNCSLPYSFWDDKRDTFEWIYFDKESGYFETHSEIFKQLGDLAHTGLTFHFEANMFSYQKDELCNKTMESHGHNFNEVISFLYQYPESFKIPEDCLNEYSEQQLRYLKRVQNYLLLIGLKDFTLSEEYISLLIKFNDLYDNKKTVIDKLKCINWERKLNKIRNQEKLERCKNNKVLKYADCWSMHIDSQDILKAMLNGKKSYRIFRYCGTRLNRKYFLLDKEENYYGVIKFDEEEKIKFKDLTDDMINFKVFGYKTFKEYKEKLYNDFLEDSKFYKEEFNENSEVLYAKFKVIEKF